MQTAFPRKLDWKSLAVKWGKNQIPPPPPPPPPPVPPGPPPPDSFLGVRMATWLCLSPSGSLPWQGRKRSPESAAAQTKAEGSQSPDGLVALLSLCSHPGFRLLACEMDPHRRIQSETLSHQDTHYSFYTLKAEGLRTCPGFKESQTPQLMCATWNPRGEAGQHPTFPSSTGHPQALP
ncbi:hypothetical protein P7K49_024386 [Saguinus oedipus]|uniref:Uncharacterized protein n=1 Tax=Saguinus oedipus TaxID=9490 RepID=A0ABQ9UQ51_SAGOE|nr:hypothetical protein P7K49_024386 [Saguinus oedipus]